MRKPDLAFWMFAAFAVAAGTISVLNVSQSHSAASSNSAIYGQLDLFGRVLEHVRDDYIEKPDDAMLIETAINGMLAALDPHSSYLNAKSYREMQVQTRGEFGGLGIEVTMELGVLKVVSPIDDTPAARAGLQANDVITHIDKEPIAGLTLEQAVSEVVHEKLGATGGTGGVIAIDPAGNIVMDFNTVGMYRAARDGHGRREIAVYRDK